MRRPIAGVLIWAAALLVLPASALASSSSTGIENLHFAAGPYKVIPGANLILTQFNKVPKPKVDGYMIQMRPNLVYAKKDGKCCGAIPDTSIVHLHHGVWLSNGKAGEGEGNGYGFYPFMAAGEEKTAIEFPAGYGYPIAAKDQWVLNYMIHNLTDKPREVYITYSMEFVPATAPLAAHITPVHPIWMDVQDHHIYPVFDVHRGSGTNGKFTYPDQANDPYGSGAPLNEFTVDHAGTLIGTAGHVHPGGLYDELDVVRSGATPSGGAVPGPVPNSVRLFRSYAHYYDKRGPVSWDVSMGVTNADWRPAVQPGDVLRVSATYDSKIASWYEVMGIMVVWEAWNDTSGTDPFTHATDQKSHLTHGHLPENSYYGGSAFVGVNPKAWAECARKKVIIAGFRYLTGDYATKTGSAQCIPTITHGHALTFVNEDASSKGTFDIFDRNPFYNSSIYHTVTSCQGSCRLNYGIAYPLAGGGPLRFDSGELGVGVPGVGTLSWSTPTNLPAGTYRYYCRIHPWMRGVFRIIR